MCMDITETYDDMKRQKRHIKVTELKLGVYEFNEESQTYYKSNELTFVDLLKEVLMYCSCATNTFKS